MSKNLRFCFRVSEEIGMAKDENGNPSETFICIKAKDVKSYSLPKEEYKELHEAFRKTTAYQLKCDVSLLTPITLNEYLDKTEEDHEAKIPELIEMWKKKGREVLTEDKWEYWDKIVPIRLDDLYEGMELGCCLDIVKILNNNGTLEEAKEMIASQGHSGMSFGLACSMVRAFCDRGVEFFSYVN